MSINRIETAAHQALAAADDILLHAKDKEIRAAAQLIRETAEHILQPTTGGAAK